MGMSLYTIDNTICDILENGFSFNEETGEVLFEESNLDELKMALDDKINNIIGYIKSIDIEVESLKKCEEDFSNRRKLKEKKSQNLKKYLDDYLQKNNIEKKECENGIVSYRASKSINVLDESELFKEIKKLGLDDKMINTKVQANKTEIKKYLQDGNKLKFAEIKENKNMVIK